MSALRPDSRVYFPLASVSVPVVVPLRKTEAYGIGLPVSASSTNPFTTVFSDTCENEFRQKESAAKIYTEKIKFLKDSFILGERDSSDITPKGNKNSSTR